MKTIKTLLLAFVLIFTLAASCEPDEPQTTQTEQCSCVKTYYLFHPSMGNGPSYIPAWYEEIDTEVGNFDCEQDTGSYVPVSNSQYSHYKIICD
jgi:hypothetical protein